MKISIIIPVYNAEQFLDTCMESILESLGQIHGEVLLIDNGSTDDSLAKMEQYKKKASRIVQVLKCDARGAGAARNFGVLKARGDYIWFIDADDYIAKEAIPSLISTAKKSQADLVMMGAQRIQRNKEKGAYLSAVLVEENYKSRFIRYGMGPWQVIIRRKWYIEHGFRFQEGIIHEDMEMMSSLILYTNKFASINQPLYFYCDNPGSVLHKAEFSPRIFDIFPALEGLYGRFEKAGATKKYHDELEWFFIWNLLIDSSKDFSQFPEGKIGFSRSREMLTKYFPKWRKNKFLRQKSLRLNIRVRLNYHKK